MKLGACGCLAILFALPSLAVAGPIRMDVSGSPMHQGSQSTLTYLVMKAQADSVTLSGPFTVRTVLPTGATYLSHTGSSWSCSDDGPPNELACVWNGNLMPSQGISSSLSVLLQIDPATQLGSVNLQNTVETAQVPLPPQPLDCPANSSNTGCVSVLLPVLPSSLKLNDWGWGHVAIDQPGPVASVTAPWEAGTVHSMVVQVRNDGYHTSNTPVEVLLHLPPGINYDAFVNGIPSWSCAAVPDGGGQLLTCSTPAMINPQNGFISLRMLVSPTVTIPGPHLVYARLRNNIQQPTLGQCIGDPTSIGCGRLSVTTRAPRVPAMEIVSTAHDPQLLHLGQQAGLLVGFRNAGEGNAMATRLIVALPPGVAFSHAVGAIPALSCTASGQVADGQRVTCEGVGLPSTLSGQVRLVMNVGYEIDTPASLTAVVGLDHAATPTAGLIEACASDPSPAWCAWHELPISWRCADEHGADGVYCDGFQLPPTF